MFRTLFALIAALGLASCVRQYGNPPESPPRPEAEPAKIGAKRVIRATGTIQALKSVTIRVPQISAQNGRLTLATLIPNGTKVAAGDLLAEFDSTAVYDEEIEVQARLAESTHQLEERQAKARSDAAKRGSALAEAEADQAKAEIQLRKGPTLGSIDRRKNEALAESAKERVASLKRSMRLRESEDEAAIGVMEKKRERLHFRLERVKANLEKMTVKAPHGGMVALENTWRNGTTGPPQEGDMMSAGQAVLRIFDPGDMVLEATVSETDVAALPHASGVRVYLDAYPGALFSARLEAASPVATAGLDTPIRTFAARFRIAERDPRLLPDLSASIEILMGAGQ